MRNISFIDIQCNINAYLVLKQMHGHNHCKDAFENQKFADNPQDC